MKMTTTPFTSDEGIKGISIEIDGRGADFYADGTYYAWDGEGAFNRCEATNNLAPYVSRNAVKEAFATAEKELFAEFEVGTIGVYVDEDGTHQTKPNENMTKSHFTALCAIRYIDPALALENENILAALRDGGDVQEIEEILDNEF